MSHKILLQKLFHYGVRGLPLKLLESYLTNRQQYTVVDGTKSDLAPVLWGVPQGSVLGPILFILFINDLPNSSALNSWLFADDTALAQSSNSIADLKNRFNLEIQKVQDWLLVNKLSVHYSKKTQFILFIPPSRAKEDNSCFSLTMGGHSIEQTATYKYLGIIIDEKLNWKPQIDTMFTKLTTVCGILSKVRHYLNRKSLMLIYNSLVESRLTLTVPGFSRHVTARGAAQ